VSHIPDGDLETLRWLTSIRFRIGFSLLLVVLFGRLAGIMSPNVTFNLFLVDVAYLLLNCVYALLLKGTPSARIVKVLRQAQVPEKVAICTLAIYVSGGVLTPMFILYTLVLLEAIILLNPRGVYLASALSILCYLGLSLLEAYRLVPYVDGPWGTSNIYLSRNFAAYASYSLVVSFILMIAGYMGNRIAHLITLRNRQIERQLRDLRTLYDITKGLGNIMDENATWRYLATTLKTLQDASMSIVCLMNKEGCLEVKASSGLPLDGTMGLCNATSDTPTLSRLLLDGEPLIVEDLDKRPEYKALLGNAPVKSVYAFPIKSEGRVLGLIALSFDRVKPLNPEYNSLLSTIAAQAGVTLQRARLFCDTQRLAREMSILYDVGLQTGSTLSKSEVLRRTSDNLVKLMNPDMYYIAMYDDVTDTVSFEVFVEDGQEIPRMRMSLDKAGLTSLIIKECKPLLVTDWLSGGEKYNAIARKTGRDVLSYLGVPMISESRVIGVISVQCAEPHAFDDHDERLLLALAAQTASALENARLHQLAQDQGKLDSLTKAYNHGHFVELVRKAVSESDGSDTSVSLIMIDIDHFKQYNDTFGHVAGDNVLRMVANALKSSVRETDFVGRWGGEEFGVLLVGASTSEAKKIARTIRRAVSELYPVDGHGHVIPNPTVSQGISSYPEPSATPSDLIEQADAALYHAKKQGRNKLVVYENSVAMREHTHSGQLRAAAVMRDATLTTGHLSAMSYFDETANTTSNLTPTMRARDKATITDELTPSRLSKDKDKGKKSGTAGSFSTSKGSKGGTTVLDTLPG
jgi:diguanylate cyclase (GGDEF)-like protein